MSTKTSILFLIILFGKITSAQNKNGYFNYKKLEQSFPLYKGLEIKLSAFEKHLEDSMIILQTNLERFFNYEITCYMDSAKIKSIKSAMKKTMIEIDEFRSKAVVRLTNEESALKLELKKYIISSISCFCSDKKIRCMADKDAVLYCPECRDYTDDIILYFKDRGKEK